MPDTTYKKIEGGRAAFAYEFAKAINDGANDKLKKAFKSHVKSFPMLVKTNGFGSALAFLFSKGDNENGVYKKVGESIVNWLLENDNYHKYSLPKCDNLKILAEAVIQLDAALYRALTLEILSYFKWLRRFAEGLYQGVEDDV